MYEFQKWLLDVDVVFDACSKILEPSLLAPLFDLLLVDVPLQIDFVPDEYHFGSFSLRQTQWIPLVHEVVEGAWTGLIEDQKHAVATFEVG